MKKLGYARDQFLITGFARSGTQYMSRCLRRYGYGVGEEEVFKHSDGVVSWIHAPLAKAFKVYAWQTRDPLKTVASAQTIPPVVYDDKVWPHIGKPKDWKDPLARAIHAWPRWYKKFSDEAAVVYKIEDISRVFPMVFKRLGLENPGYWTKKVPTNQNTREHDEVTWEQVKETNQEDYEKILAISKELKYD